MILKTYYGYINDEEKIKKSASGGLATALSEKMISTGNVVYGVAYSYGFTNVEYIRIDKEEEIALIKGSKYIKASLNSEILEMLSSDLKAGKSVLFTGLPCDVNIVKTYLDRHRIDDTHLLCVDLICHGPTSPGVAKEYIAHLEKKYKSSIFEFSVRYKDPFWTPQYLYAKFLNGKEYKKPFYDTEYGLAFSLMPVHTSCYKCSNKGGKSKSDITIGDYWGIKADDIGYNKYGTSIAFVHTEKGEGFITTLKNFCLFEADTSTAIKGTPRYLTSIYSTPQAARFRKRFERKGLYYAVSRHYGIKKYVPKFIKKAVRKILHITKTTARI